MSGILNNKNRIIDYVLTDNGRQQLSTNDFRIKYATFLDNIHYDVDHEKNKYYKVSRSENAYLPIEPNSNCDLIINNEYNVYSKFFIKNNIFKNSNNYTLTEKILNIQNISSKKFIFSETYISNISYENIYDFKNSYFVKKYLTIKQTLPNTFDPVIGDPRFLHKTNFKKLIPINVSGEKVIEDNTVINPINYIFKTLKTDHKILETDNRELAISKAVEQLNKNNCFSIEIDLENTNINDYYLFELNETIDAETYEKLHFINLGEIYDTNQRKYKKVYIIGKFKEIPKNDFYLSEIYYNNNPLNYETITRISNQSIFSNSKETGINYNKLKRLFETTFINMFTMVLEW